MIDKEALEDELFKHRPITSMKDGSIAGCTCMDRVFVNGVEDWDSHVADALLASGVLGVPADQRTADREAIARALFARSLDRLGHGYPTEAITWEVTDQESWRRDADAVLAVLVPAENA